MLYILTLIVSKVSVLILLRQITPVRLHRRLALWVGVFLVVWGLASFVSSGFQCRLPAAWKILGEHCMDQVRHITTPFELFPEKDTILNFFDPQLAFWKAFAILNILTEIALIALPFYTIWQVHLRVDQKLTVIGCFSLRAT